MATTSPVQGVPVGTSTTGMGSAPPPHPAEALARKLLRQALTPAGGDAQAAGPVGREALQQAARLLAGSAAAPQGWGSAGPRLSPSQFVLCAEVAVKVRAAAASPFPLRPPRVGERDAGHPTVRRRRRSPVPPHLGPPPASPLAAGP